METTVPASLRDSPCRQSGAPHPSRASRWLRFLPCVALVIGSAARAASGPPEPAPAREGTEWCDIWLAHANHTSLPRVLLIGDSISRDYYPEVARQLEARASVSRLSTSAFVSDPLLLKEIAMVLDAMKFDVIHLNNGLHGGGHDEAEYEEAFPAFLATIRRHAPDARLIWATTTSLRKQEEARPVKKTELTDERIDARNAIARRLVAGKVVAIDDLHTLMAAHPGCHRDRFHYTPEGVSFQAQQVAQSIGAVLSGRK